MRKFEYVLCALLALGGVGHLFGTFTGYEIGSEVFVWSLSATAFTFLIVFPQVLRIQRADDGPVRTAATVATIVWIGLALGFGASVGNIADPRAMMHAVVSALLVVTTVLGRSRRPASAGA